MAIGCVRGGFGEAVAALTTYRRGTRRFMRHEMRAYPVIFKNVAMLDDDQTAGTEMPLVEAPAAVAAFTRPVFLPVLHPESLRQVKKWHRGLSAGDSAVSRSLRRSIP